MSKTIEQEELRSPNILGMITSPRKQLKLITNNPLIVKPLLIVSFITILSGIILYLGSDFSGDPLPEGKTLFDVLSFNIMNLIFLAIGTTLVYSFIHFLAAKVIKSKVRIIELVSMNAHIAIIPAIGILFNTILFYFMKDTVSVSSFTTLGNLVKNNDILKATLKSFELFMVWQFILMALALQVVGKFTKKSAWVVILLLFFILVSLDMSVAASGINK